jgi:tetratricopeptide (TPR) repeat protein
MEIQAADHVKKREWTMALEFYNKLLQKQNNSEQQILTYLLDRSECLYHLGHHETIINDCRQILKTFSGKYNSTNEPRTRIQLIRSLFALNRLGGGYPAPPQPHPQNPLFQKQKALSRNG